MIKISVRNNYLRQSPRKRVHNLDPLNINELWFSYSYFNGSISQYDLSTNFFWRFSGCSKLHVKYVQIEQPLSDEQLIKASQSKNLDTTSFPKGRSILIEIFDEKTARSRRRARATWPPSFRERMSFTSLCIPHHKNNECIRRMHTQVYTATNGTKKLCAT